MVKMKVISSCIVSPVITLEHVQTKTTTPKLVLTGVKNPKYKCGENEKNMEEWFRNFKKTLKRHLLGLAHHKKAAIYEVLQKSTQSSMKKIEETCSNILYYIIKTNTAWTSYPSLLGVLLRSGHEVGNLNHSKYTCEIMCSLLDSELRAEARDWFLQQKSVTLTADIGTILGLSMIVVLLESESDSTVKLAGVSLVRSKSGP